MSESKHTPGPWVASNVFAPFQVRSADMERPIANIWQGYKVNAEANAHLIAAAPDLLAAGKCLSKLADEIWVKMSTAEAQAMAEAYAALDAAIAKAEGRS